MDKIQIIQGGLMGTGSIIRTPILSEEERKVVKTNPSSRVTRDESRGTKRVVKGIFHKNRQRDDKDTKIYKLKRGLTRSKKETQEMDEDTHRPLFGQERVSTVPNPQSAAFRRDLKKAYALATNGQVIKIGKRVESQIDREI